MLQCADTLLEQLAAQSWQRSTVEQQQPPLYRKLQLLRKLLADPAASAAAIQQQLLDGLQGSLPLPGPAASKHDAAASKHADADISRAAAAVSLGSFSHQVLGDQLVMSAEMQVQPPAAYVCSASVMLAAGGSAQLSTSSCWQPQPSGTVLIQATVPTSSLMPVMTSSSARAYAGGPSITLEPLVVISIQSSSESSSSITSSMHSPLASTHVLPLEPVRISWQDIVNSQQQHQQHAAAHTPGRMQLTGVAGTLQQGKRKHAAAAYQDDDAETVIAATPEEMILGTEVQDLPASTQQPAGTIQDALQATLAEHTKQAAAAGSGVTPDRVIQQHLGLAMVMTTQQASLRSLPAWLQQQWDWQIVTLPASPQQTAGNDDVARSQQDQQCERSSQHSSSAAWRLSPGTTGCPAGNAASISIITHGPKAAEVTLAAATTEGLTSLAQKVLLSLQMNVQVWSSCRSCCVIARSCVCYLAWVCQSQLSEHPGSPPAGTLVRIMVLAAPWLTPCSCSGLLLWVLPDVCHTYVRPSLGQTTAMLPTFLRHAGGCGPAGIAQMMCATCLSPAQHTSHCCCSLLCRFRVRLPGWSSALSRLQRWTGTWTRCRPSAASQTAASACWSRLCSQQEGLHQGSRMQRRTCWTCLCWWAHWRRSMWSSCRRWMQLWLVWCRHRMPLSGWQALSRGELHHCLLSCVVCRYVARTWTIQGGVGGWGCAWLGACHHRVNCQG